MVAVKITLKNGRVLEFYDHLGEYSLKHIAEIINNNSKCICIENVLIMKEEVSTLEIY